MKKILLMFIICLSLFFVTPTNFVFARADETSLQNRTIFVVDSKFIANTSDGVYLYDNSDKCVKLLNNSPALSKSYYIGDCIDMYSLDNSIYFLTNENIVAFDTNNGSTSVIEVDKLQSYHNHITAGKVNDQTVICVYPDDTANNQDVIYGLITSDDPQFFKITFDRNGYNPITTISGLNIAHYNNQTYLITYFEQSITAFRVPEFANDIVLNENITLNTIQQDDQSPIIKLESFLYDNSTFFAISHESKTDIYEFVGSGDLSFKSTLSHIYEQSAFACKDMSVNQNSIAIMSNNKYFLSSYSNSNIAISKSMANPLIEVTPLSANNFEYYKTTKQTQLISQLGTQEITNLPTDSIMVKIADCTLSDNSKLLGYEYVMFVRFDNESQNIGKNIFGYVLNDNSQIQKIDQSASQKTVKVFDNTKLYKFPSIISDDDQNCVITNISANMPVTILCNIEGYKHNYNDTTTNYALAKVGDYIGFIDTKAIVSTDKRVILVIPNAQLLIDSQVYEQADTQTNILHTLTKSKKVKVLEGRDSSGFMKIAYNDDEGNYFEGYIQAENIKADSYSTLQIIGMVLVLLNCVFLAILLITKRKVTS